MYTRNPASHAIGGGGGAGGVGFRMLSRFCGIPLWAPPTGRTLHGIGLQLLQAMRAGPTERGAGGVSHKILPGWKGWFGGKEARSGSACSRRFSAGSRGEFSGPKISLHVVCPHLPVNLEVVAASLRQFQGCRHWDAAGSSSFRSWEPTSTGSKVGHYSRTARISSTKLRKAWRPWKR